MTRNEFDELFVNKDFFNFYYKFGVIGYMEPTGIFGYAPREIEENGFFVIPDFMTKNELFELSQRSLRDNKDYVYDYLKKNGKFIEQPREFEF